MQIFGQDRCNISLATVTCDGVEVGLCNRIYSICIRWAHFQWWDHRPGMASQCICLHSGCLRTLSGYSLSDWSEEVKLKVCSKYFLNDFLWNSLSIIHALCQHFKTILLHLVAENFWVDAFGRQVEHLFKPPVPSYIYCILRGCYMRSFPRWMKFWKQVLTVLCQDLCNIDVCCMVVSVSCFSL